MPACRSEAEGIWHPASRNPSSRCSWLAPDRAQAHPGPKDVCGSKLKHDRQPWTIAWASPLCRNCTNKPRPICHSPALAALRACRHFRFPCGGTVPFKASRRRRRLLQCLSSFGSWEHSLLARDGPYFPQHLKHVFAPQSCSQSLVQVFASRGRGCSFNAPGPR